MKFTLYIFIVLLLSYSSKSFAQIYNIAKEIKFSVKQENNGEKSLDSEVMLICEGHLWEMPLVHKTEKDNWSIKWKFNTVEGRTGVIESKDEIFLHPPRMGIFMMLEFCPFPIIHYPLAISKTWSYKLFGTEGYFRSIKKKFDGEIDVEVESNYLVNRKLIYYSPYLRKYIECYETRATGYTRYGVV